LGGELKPIGSLNRGDFVAAMWEGEAYRGRVRSVEKDGGARIAFVDLGIESPVPAGDLRALPPEIADVPVQGLRAKLGGVRPIDRERAGEFLWGITEGQVFEIRLMFEDEWPGVLLVAKDGESANARLVREGLAKVFWRDVDPQFGDLLRRFRELEELAKRDGKGAWDDVEEDVG
jgi:hypothetical protein